MTPEPYTLEPEEPQEVKPQLAAAPDLLSACEAALNAFEYLRDVPSMPVAEHAPIIAQLRAAIKKAKGESNVG